MTRTNPSSPTAWIPGRVEGEPIWFSDDGGYVLLRRESWERLHVRLLQTHEAPSRPLAAHAPPPIPDDADEVPTVVSDASPPYHHDGPSMPEPSHRFGPDATTTSYDPPSTAVGPDDARLTRINLALAALSAFLLSVAAGIWIGSGGLRSPAPAPAAIAVPPAPQTAPAAPPIAAPVTPAPPAAVEAPPEPEAVAPPPDAAPAAAPPTPHVEPPPAAPRPVATAPAAAAPPAAVAPQPAPTATPAPPPPKPSVNVADAIARGWEAVESDPLGAEASFRAVLGARPADPEAHYGLGYALLQQGDRAGAARHLCRARGGSDATRREVTGLLQANGLACE